jgi:hypothetical protein
MCFAIDFDLRVLTLYANAVSEICWLKVTIIVFGRESQFVTELGVVGSFTKDSV